MVFDRRRTWIPFELKRKDQGEFWEGVFSDFLAFWLDGLEEEVIARIKRIKALCFNVFVLSCKRDVCNEFMWMPGEAPSGDEEVFIFPLVLADTL